MNDPGQDFLQGLAQRACAQPINRFFGIKIEDIAPGRAVASMVCGDKLANVLGLTHGSAVFALIDEAFQAAVNAHGTEAVALNVTVTFHSAPKPGERITATAEETSSRGRIAAYQIAVYDAEHVLVASCYALAYRKGAASRV